MRDSIDIVTAGGSDAPLLDIWMQAFYAEEHLVMRPENLQAMRALLETPALGCILIVRNEGNPVGYCVLTYGYSLERAGRMALIDELFVLPQERGRGIGRSLLEAALKKACGAGCSAACLEVDQANSRVLDLYRRAGFVANNRDILAIALT